MSWLIAIGCIMIVGVVVYYVNNSSNSRLPHRRSSRELPDTSSIRWRDLSTSSSSLPTSIPDPSLIRWVDMPTSSSDISIPDQSSITWVDTPPELLLNNSDISEEGVYNDNYSNNRNTTFLDSEYNPTIQELLIAVIGSRDPLTLDDFLPGQQVYFCSHCTLAYHENSWRDNGNKCYQCGSDQHSQLYTLPRNY